MAFSKGNTRQLDALFDQGKELIEFYRANPCMAAYDLLRVDLAPIQRLIFKDMWFRNYVIAVCGRGVGKSTHVNSLTHFKEKGLVYLNEVLPPIPSYLRDGEEEVINWCDEIYTSEGFRNTEKLSLEKGIEGKRVITQNGFTSMGSNHHPLLTLDIKGNFIYRSLAEFKPGDRVCIQRNQQVFGKHVFPLADAFLIGLFIGDGCIGEGYPPNITTADSYITAFCTNYCIDNSIEYRVAEDKRTRNTVSIYFKKFESFFDRYGVKRTLSYDKVVPYSIRTATREVQKQFLRGYFSADGGVERGAVSCCSVSKNLIIEIQQMLLNFGIVSRHRKKKTKSKFGKAYILYLGSKDALLFKKLIGFGIDRKQSLLDKYFINRKLNVNKDTIPYALQMCYSITKYYHSTYRTRKKPAFRIKINNKKELTYSRLGKFLAQCAEVEKAGFSLMEVWGEIDKLKEIFKYNYFFDTVTSVKDWKGDCYDFEMSPVDGKEPNYFSNGFINHNTFLLGVLAALSSLLYPGYRVGLIAPVFRQSKMIFSEVEKLYSKSSILKEATEKRPTRGSDTCYLKFKSVGGYNGSFIEALPLGDGGKIRGSRFYLILIDELAQVPDKVLDMVVRPMGATTLEPMENVRRLQQQRKLIDKGLATEDDFEDNSVNKMVMASSGYYKFNHMWRRMKDYWRQMDLHKDESQYKVWQVPYWDLPEGFLDINNITEAKRIMSAAEYRMEYEAGMTSDSEGFFKASLLEACSIGTGFSVELDGDSRGEYVLGVDPSQGGTASCGMVLIKMGAVHRVVNVMELKKKTTQDLTKTVQKICKQFNVLRIFMDKGGGGKAICDLLEDGYDGAPVIIDRTNDDHRHLQGRHILEMVTFNPTWISDANFTTLSLLEDHRLQFPEPPIHSTLDIAGIIYENVKTLKSQMLNIIVTQTRGGLLHFDTPTKSQNKDLYSAIILAAHGVRMLEKEMEEPEEPQLYGIGGMVRERNKVNPTWDPIVKGRGGLAGGMLQRSLGSAVITKKIK